MNFSKLNYSILFFALLAIVSCGPTETPVNGSTTGNTTSVVETKPRVVPPDFNADSAYAFTKYQADLGPRTPGSKAHAAAVKWMNEKLKGYGATVVVQDGVVTTFDQKKWNAKNVIGSFNPDAK